MKKFTIESNSYLQCNTTGYYHCVYTGFNQPNNPNYINTLKNTYNNTNLVKLQEARDTVKNILLIDIPVIIKNETLENCYIMNVPRAKSLKMYSSKQLMLIEGIGLAAREISSAIDATNSIVREVDTRTTHIHNPVNLVNAGELPYVGITKDTCKINVSNVKGKNIILIDDIYTKSININEDCIQALIDNGAKKVVYYSIGHTGGVE